MNPAQAMLAAQVAEAKQLAADAQRAIFAKDLLAAMLRTVVTSSAEEAEIPREVMGTLAAAAVALTDELLAELARTKAGASRY